MSARAGLVSIHDVAPATMGPVRHLIKTLRAFSIQHYTLLVIPGQDWTDADLAELRDWHADGAVLAGHGWSHQCLPPQHVRHYLHSKLISRNVAEHFSCSRSEGIALMDKCHRWFEAHDLPAPRLYVPPAWTLGPMQIRDLQQTPFDCVEVLAGVITVASGKTTRLPLVGFEADTRLRKWFLIASNGCNQMMARASGHPLRVAIHPQDLSLLVSDQLRHILQTLGQSQTYHAYQPGDLTCWNGSRPTKEPLPH